jgi:exodeoxyribonuclease V alpha subunit
MPEIANPWLSLTADEATWPEGFGEVEREEILNRLAAGEIAVQYSGTESNQVFRINKIGSKSFLVPHRYWSLMDFFLLRPGGEPGKTQEDALKILGQGKHLILTGGPGTGKSYTISSFVEALKPIAGRPPRVAIAAPTGKAAARFQHLAGSSHALVECSTLHRLLGLSHDERRLRYSAQNPLPYDILIIDEISMLDLGLFAAAIRALPEAAQLLLAGDLDQLPAVDGLPIDRAIRFLSAESVIAHVHLTQVQRFAPEKANAYRSIAEHGIRALDNPGVAAVVKHLQLKGPAALGDTLDRYTRERLCSKKAETIRNAFSNLKPGMHPTAELAAAAFDFLKRQVILTERREGGLGSIALNRRLAAELVRATKNNSRTLEPVMNTINNYDLQIYNGDVGFIWDAADERCAVFATPEGGFRVLALSELTGAETAYAMTIHKSQGSEYEDAFVVCEGGANIDRRLLYTAVTRAKSEATILEIVR